MVENANLPVANVECVPYGLDVFSFSTVGRDETFVIWNNAIMIVQSPNNITPANAYIPIYKLTFWPVAPNEIAHHAQ